MSLSTPFLSIPEEMSSDREELLSFSDEVDYIPIQALNSAESYRTDVNRILVYKLKVHTDGWYNTRSYDEFVKHLQPNRRREGNWMKLSQASVGNEFYLGANGILIHIDTVGTGDVVHLKGGKITPLYVMCVKKDKLHLVNRNNPDPRHFIAVVNREFIEHPEFFKVYRNIKKHFLDELEKVMDVVYVPDIYRSCYKGTIDRPRFATVNEMVEYEKQISVSIFQDV